MNPLNFDNRNYKCPDSILKQRSDLVALFIERDIAQFNLRSVTMVTVGFFKDLIVDFFDVTSDIELRGAIGEAVEIRNAKRVEVLKNNVMIRTMVMNKWGEKSAKYRMYGWDGMSELTDDFLCRLTKVIVNQATKHLALAGGLATEGLTSAMLTALTDLNSEFDDAIDNVGYAISARAEGAHERVTKGNILFKEFARLCNIGKELFNGVDGAKYKDYLMGLSSVPDSEEGDEFGSVTGVASHSGNNQALEGVQVTLSGEGMPDLVMNTNANGIYSEEHVSTDYTSLMAAKAGFLVYTATIIVPPNGELVHNIAMVPDNA